MSYLRCIVLLAAAFAILASPKDLSGQSHLNSSSEPTNPPNIEDLRNRATKGEAEAQYKLGECYSEGNGVPQDNSQAWKWDLKVAKQGHAMAQYSVGQMLLNGRGVKKNLKEAASWFRKAAEQDEAYSQDELALMYEKGTGVSQDEKQAIYWYTRAADLGLPIAQFDLGYMYEDGLGVPADAEKAARLYEKAALHVPTARHNLAVLYAQGKGSLQLDLITSYKWALLEVSAESQRMLHEKKLPLHQNVLALE